MEFSRQEYWSGLPFSSPGDLPNPGIKPGSPALQTEALPSEPPGKKPTVYYKYSIYLVSYLVIIYLIIYNTIYLYINKILYVIHIYIYMHIYTPKMSLVRNIYKPYSVKYVIFYR